MPTVPVLGTQQVASRPMPDVRTSPEAFGAAPAAPDLSGLTAQAHAIWQEAKQKADEIVLTGAAWQVSTLETALATHARSQLGTNAYALPDDIGKAWNEQTADIAKGLTNDDQKLQFQNVVQSHWNALNDIVQGHVAQQHKVVDGQATDGYTAAEANAAVENYMDPLRVSEAVGNSAAAIRAYGQRNGQAKEYVDAHVAENTSKIHVAVIDRMLANDQDIAAKKYYDAVKGQIDSQQLPSVDRALEIGSSRVESQAQAQKIMSSTTTRADALDAVDQIADPKVQDLTRQRVERLWAQKDDNAREVAAARMQQATDIVRQTKDFNRIPPSLLVGMSVEHQDALLTFAKRLQEGPIKTDRTTFGDLTKMFSNPDSRQAAMKLDLNLYTARLSDEDYKHFSELQGGLIKGDPAAEHKLDGIFTNLQIVESGLKKTGLLDTQGVSAEARKANETTVDNLKQTINNQVQDLEAHTKRPATSKDVQDITNEVLTQHIVSSPGRFFGTNTDKKRIDQMGPNDQLIVKTSDIPRADYRAIVQQLRVQGMPLTDDNVVQAYKNYLMRLKPRGR